MNSVMDRIAEWVRSRFGANALHDRQERVARLLEEAAELAQAEGLALDTAQRILARTYSRPVGEVGSEVAGVGLTLAAYCVAAGLDPQALMRAELKRVEAVPRAVTLAKHAAKVADGTSSISADQP